MPRMLTRSVVLPIVVAIAGCAGVGTAAPAPDASPAAAAAPSKPSLVLTITPAETGQLVRDAGTYTWDPDATLDVCVASADGYWRVQYAGGEPWFGVDLLVGPSALADGRSEDMSAEIQVGSPLTTYLWIDQPGHRGGDAPGRSRAVVEGTKGDGSITFDVVANTPVRTTGGDRARLDVTLTATCPVTD